MAMDDRLTRLERLAPDVDALIEAELARMTPDEADAFIRQCAIDFGVQSFGPTGTNELDSKKDVRNGNG